MRDGSRAWIDRLGAFEAYSSPWFSAIYLLLCISLIGCILPRTGVHPRALRGRPTCPPDAWPLVGVAIGYLWEGGRLAPFSVTVDEMTADFNAATRRRWLRARHRRGRAG